MILQPYPSAQIRSPVGTSPLHYEISQESSEADDGAVNLNGHGHQDATNSDDDELERAWRYPYPVQVIHVLLKPPEPFSYLADHTAGSDSQGN
jgi:hypothetical protein